MEDRGLEQGYQQMCWFQVSRLFKFPDFPTSRGNFALSVTSRHMTLARKQGCVQVLSRSTRQCTRQESCLQEYFVMPGQIFARRGIPLSLNALAKYWRPPRLHNSSGKAKEL